MKLADYLLMLSATACAACGSNPHVFTIEPVDSADATCAIQEAIDSAAKINGHVEIKLLPGVYNIFRENCTFKEGHISNTTSITENPDQTKHYGLYLHDLSDVTISGHEATLLTHGELTLFCIDNCHNVTLQGITVDAADPSVPEMTVEQADEYSITARVNPRSQYEIGKDSTLYWVGHDWKFTKGIAQSYDPDTKMTLRCKSPLQLEHKAVEIEPGLVRFTYAQPHPFKAGLSYQMRHSIRNEACGFINESSDISLADMHFCFLGNFGIVSQNSANIRVKDCTFAPSEESGRKCAGFADFLQFSGCRGYIKVENCDFSGAHDDAINVHGTHLKITGQPKDNTLCLRYMHDQTWGFNSFYPGDSIDIVDCATLNGHYSGRVVSSTQISPYDWEIELDTIIAPLDSARSFAVENISATPAVEIRNCHFTLVPTRGVLVTSRRPSVIENCVFERTPMSAILICDDARGWYESGPVENLVIRNNHFIDCDTPIISISPEVAEGDHLVHSGIVIAHNIFEGKNGPAVYANRVAGIVIYDNQLKGIDTENAYLLRNCLEYEIEPWWIE